MLTASTAARYSVSFVLERDRCSIADESLVRCLRLVFRPFEREFGEIKDRLNRHLQGADWAAVSAELQAAQISRQGMWTYGAKFMK